MRRQSLLTNRVILGMLVFFIAVAFWVFRVRQQYQPLYKEGVVDYLVLLDAQRERLNAEDAQALGETDQYRAIVAIYKSLGGGWDSGDTRLAKNN